MRRSFVANITVSQTQVDGPYRSCGIDIARYCSVIFGSFGLLVLSTRAEVDMNGTGISVVTAMHRYNRV